jgi:predicted RNA-binding Zn-ribbon protein involved in translation (DUF1610 family)
MRIKQILHQYRRDFKADYECEHCGYIDTNKPGYDDAYFHKVAIPKKICPKCGKTADENYRPLTTKYPEGMTI